MQFFNQSVTRMVATSLMDFLSRISIEKFQTITSSGGDYFAQRKVIPVPIQWATREKWVEIVRSSSSRKAMDPSIHNLNPVEMQWILPRISCNLTGVVYDPSRRLIKTQQVEDYTNTTPSSKGKVYTPAPYLLDFEVATIARHLDDNLQIMEQIIPYFAPTMNLSLNLYDSRETESVPITLTSITIDNPTDIPENDERIFTNVYSFQAKINYYMMKKVYEFINMIDVNMQNGAQIVKLSKTWVESQNRIQTRFTEYEANAGRVNPLVNFTSSSPMPNYTDSARIEEFNTMMQLQLISESLSGLGTPFIHAFTTPGSAVSLVTLTTDVASGYNSNFFVYYRLDDDMTVYKYEQPIEITPDMTRLYCWVVYSDQTNASQFNIITYSVAGIGGWTITDEQAPTTVDFSVG